MKVKIEINCLLKKYVKKLYIFLFVVLIKVFGRKKVSFGIITDIHYSKGKNVEFDRYFDLVYKRVIEAISSFNLKKVDFVVNLGDTINDETSNWLEILNIFGGLKSNLYHVLGNHDFLNLNFNPVELLNVENGYYSFVFNKYRFIILNGNEISKIAYNKDHENYNKAEMLIEELSKKVGEENVKDYNGAIDVNQIVWLESVLRESNINNEKVFIFCHFPVFPNHHSNLWNSDKILDIIKNFSNIVAFFNGHYHFGNVNQYRSIWFIGFKAMVNTNSLTSYAVVNVYKSYLLVDGYGRENSFILKV